VGVCRLCIQLIRGSGLYINTPSSLKKRDKSVGNVGNVGKSEKSTENSPRKVFQNAYIAYTTYIGRWLEMDHWLDTVPLHSAGSAVLVNIRQFFEGFFQAKPLPPVPDRFIAYIHPSFIKQVFHILH
jgi:hypothetical protein